MGKRTENSIRRKWLAPAIKKYRPRSSVDICSGLLKELIKELEKETSLRENKDY